jgi:class 3 adenylate cyclase
VARLSARDRAQLPDSAFAYVDESGERRLPMNDESHVRNALSRFGQVQFENDEARQQARRRLLQAAKRHGIVPIGFMEGEVRTAGKRSAAGRLVIELGRIETSGELERELRRTLRDPDLRLLRWSKPLGTYLSCDEEPVALPRDDSPMQTTFLQGRGRPLLAIIHAREALRSPETTEAVLAAVHLVTGRELLDEVDEMGVATEGLPEGTLTFLLTDIEGSTLLLRSLGDDYADVLRDVRTVIRESVLRASGRQVEARADEFVAVFESSTSAVTAAVDMQRRLATHEWSHDHAVRIRAGLHGGEILLTEAGYVGMTVHMAARIMSAAHGGQIVVSRHVCDACAVMAEVTFRSLGGHELRGLSDHHELFQIEADGLADTFPAPNT